jgi:hypothetical protein
MDFIIDGYSIHITMFSDLQNRLVLEDENVVLLAPKYVISANQDNKLISYTISNK